MQIRPFGNTDLRVSAIGFGAWGIGGPAMAGDTAIGWGEVDDGVSVRAIEEAVDRGINFFDTADFYGLGHSEKLLGETLGNRSDVVIASKAGHVLGADGSPAVDYSRSHILEACEASLKRLKRDVIDFYQLHSARVSHLEDGACVEAMEQLREQGKIRYWGLSLNTFDPFSEADYMLRNGLGSGLQLVFNIINQRAAPIIDRAREAGMGVIARMPLQFGLLTGKFDRNARFGKTDHRSTRLKPEVLDHSLAELESVWILKEKYGCSETALSLSFILSYPGVSTVIPGIKTPEQAADNTTGLVELDEADVAFLRSLFERRFDSLVSFMHEAERG